MRSIEVDVDTSGKLVTNVTERVRVFAEQTGDDGLVHVFVPHATAGVTLMETGSGSEEDMAELFERVFPRDDRYVHRHGPAGHGGDHLVPAVIGSTLTLPVDGGRLVLGTWQSVVIIDPNRENNARRLRLSFLAG